MKHKIKQPYWDPGSATLWNILCAATFAWHSLLIFSKGSSSISEHKIRLSSVVNAPCMMMLIILFIFHADIFLLFNLCNCTIDISSPRLLLLLRNAIPTNLSSHSSSINWLNDSVSMTYWLNRASRIRSNNLFAWKCKAKTSTRIVFTSHMRVPTNTHQNLGHIRQNLVVGFFSAPRWPKKSATRANPGPAKNSSARNFSNRTQNTAPVFLV